MAQFNAAEPLFAKRHTALQNSQTAPRDWNPIRFTGYNAGQIVGDARWNLTGARGIGNANFLVGLHFRGRSDVLRSVFSLQSAVAADRISRSSQAV